MLDKATKEIKIFFIDKAPEMITSLATALVILLAAFIFGKLLASTAGKALRKNKKSQVKTLAPIIETLTFGVVISFGTVIALDNLGIDIATLLAGAGVLGLAIGFGAQTLVKDCLSGFSLIFEGVIIKGDYVEYKDIKGTVEEIGLRITKIRSFDGRLWYVPNGSIDTIANYHRQWIRAIVEVGVAYEQDVKEALKILQKVGDTWAEENKEIILEPPVAQGALGLNSSDIGLRIIAKIKTQGLMLWEVQRDLRIRIKAAFDENGIEIPFPRQVVYHRQDPDSPGPMEVNILDESNSKQQTSNHKNAANPE